MKKIFVRPIAALLLSLSLIFLNCAGCEEKGSGASSAGGGQIRILLDLPKGERTWEGVGADFAKCVEFLGGPNRDELEFEALPEDETERETRIASLRTEIMAGGGPDVFILSCDVPSWETGTAPVYGENGRYESKSRLFPNVEAAIRNGMFLPLDDYAERAEYLDLSLINPAVLEACRGKEGLAVLPIAITFPVAVYMERELDDPKNLPASWEEAVGWKDEGVRNAYGTAAWNSFTDLFSTLADYSTDTLTFTEEELQNRVGEALSLKNDGLLEHAAECRRFPSETFGGFLSVRSLNRTDVLANSARVVTGRQYENESADVFRDGDVLVCMNYWNDGFYDCRWTADEGRQTLASVRNDDGGVTAGISAYVCVNANTERPEDSFKVAEALLETRVQSYGFIPCTDGSYQDGFTDLLSTCYGVPARDDLMASGELSFQKRYISASLNERTTREADEIALAQYRALREEIASARFYSTLDAELQALYEDCLSIDGGSNSAEKDDAIRERVSQCYDTMKMILAES